VARGGRADAVAMALGMAAPSFLQYNVAQPSESLFIAGLPAAITDESLAAVFNQYGKVQQAKLMDPIPGMMDRSALVQMSTVDEAAWLVTNVNQNIPSGLATPVMISFLAGGVPAATPGMMPGMSALGIPGMMPGLAGFAAMPGMAAMPTAAAAGGAAQMQTGVTMQGTVKRWDSAKGFGFIVPDGIAGIDVFAHSSELAEGEVLINGNKVMFEASLDSAKGPGRYRAKNVRGGVKKEQAAAAIASDNLFVAGLPTEISEEQVKAIFNQYGLVNNVKKLPSQLSRGDCAALVRMTDVNQAKWLVDNVHNNIPSGLSTPVQIRFAENKLGRVNPPGTVPGAAEGGAEHGKAATTPAVTGAAPY